LEKYIEKHNFVRPTSLSQLCVHNVMNLYRGGPMMMCYNFFVGMCSRCSELIHIDKMHKLSYNISK